MCRLHEKYMLILIVFIPILYKNGLLCVLNVKYLWNICLLSQTYTTMKLHLTQLIIIIIILLSKCT